MGLFKTYPVDVKEAIEALLQVYRSKDAAASFDDVGTLAWAARERSEEVWRAAMDGKPTTDDPIRELCEAAFAMGAATAVNDIARISRDSVLLAGNTAYLTDDALLTGEVAGNA